MKRVYLILLSFSLLWSFSDNAHNKVSSPDKSLYLKIDYNNGQVLYTVFKNNKNIVDFR